MTLNIKPQKKIAIITPYGAEPRLEYYAEFLLAKGLNNRGFPVRFFTYRMDNNRFYKSAKLVYHGININRCKQYFGLSPSLWFKLILWKPDIVFCFHPRNFLGLTSFVAARLVGAKFIYELVGILHDPFVASDRDYPIETVNKDALLIKNFWQFVMSVFSGANLMKSWLNFIFHTPVAKADRLVAISEDEQTYIRHFYNRDSVLIPWSLPSDAMSRQTKPKPLIPDDYLFFIGQIKKRKGWDTALECLKVLKEKNIHKNLVFVAPLAEIDEAVGYAKKMSVYDRVIFLTGVSNEEKSWLYHHSSYVLVPSRYEGFGLSVLEAFQSGKPLIASDIPVFKEFLSDKKNALLFRTGDAVDLARRIIEIDNDSQLRKNIVNAGLETAQHYTDKIMVDKFLQLINSL